MKILIFVLMIIFYNEQYNNWKLLDSLNWYNFEKKKNCIIV